MSDRQPQPITNFSSMRGAYGCFSNFAPYAITVSGKRWPTSEHYFQAMKLARALQEEAIRLAKTRSAWWTRWARV